MTKKQQKTITIAVVALLILTAGTYFLLIGPQWKARGEANMKAEQVSSEASAKATQADALQAKASKIGDTITAVNKLTAQFPTNYEQGAWMAMMYQAAAQSQVHIETITPSVPVDPSSVDSSGNVTAPLPPLATLPGQPAPVTSTATTAGSGDFTIAQSAVTIVAAGPPANLVTFLSSLENLARPLVVTTVKLSGDPKDGYTITVTGKTYLTRQLPVPKQYQQH